MSVFTAKQERLKALLGDIPAEVSWEDEVGSTNDLSSQIALQGKENLVIADVQSHGMGRLGRSFVSGKGGLYESLAVCINDIFPEGEQADLNQTLHFPLLVALGVMNAVRNTCETCFGVDVIPDIKWPNDLQIAGKKICGILCRAAQQSGKWFFIAGIGVNICNELPEDLPDASNIKNLLTHIPDDADWESFQICLAAEIYKEVRRNLKEGIRKREELLDEVEAHCITIGKKVEVPERGVSGRAVQIGDDGSLCIQTEEGEYEIIKSGDVVIVS